MSDRDILRERERERESTPILETRMQPLMHRGEYQIALKFLPKKEDLIWMDLPFRPLVCPFRVFSILVPSMMVSCWYLVP